MPQSLCPTGEGPLMRGTAQILKTLDCLHVFLPAPRGHCTSTDGHHPHV